MVGNVPGQPTDILLETRDGGRGTGGYDQETAPVGDSWSSWAPKEKGKGKEEGKGKSNGKGIDLLCVNCSARGHDNQQCLESIVLGGERPCRRCGKKGHVLSSYPDRPKPTNAITEEPLLTHYFLVKQEFPHPTLNRFAVLRNDVDEDVVPDDRYGDECNQTAHSPSRRKGDGQCEERCHVSDAIKESLLQHS